MVYVSLTASKGISARGGSGSFTAVTDDEPLRYGKVPRQAALNRKVYIRTHI